jgi:DNA-binding transcriptional ArsR family regulator
MDAGPGLANISLQRYVCDMTTPSTPPTGSDSSAASTASAPASDGARTLDVTSLRALAHPLRVRLLALLREDGPATASGLARRLGESSGATSYHLRQLARHGFVVEDAGRGATRERWWRAAQRTTWVNDGGNPDLTPHLNPDREAGRHAATEGYLRAVAQVYAARVDDWIGGLDAADTAWRGTGTISDWSLRLTPDEARALVADLRALAARYRLDDPDRPAGPPDAERVVLQYAVLPRASAAAASAPR